MRTGLEALESIDWHRLHHAYGRAADTPGHLRALLEDDADGRRRALGHLKSAIMHQGTPWTATGPAALVVVGLLADARIDRVEGTRPALLEFLVEIAVEVIAQARPRIAELERQAAFDLEPFIDLAEDDSAETETDSVFYDAISDNEAAGNAFYARSQLDCIAAAPAIEQAMGAALDHARPRVRAIAVARVTEKFAIDRDWGPLLAAAFPRGGGVVETEAQRRFLAALVENADLWDPKLGNASKWFTRAGLRYDRDACAQLAGRA